MAVFVVVMVLVVIVVMAAAMAVFVVMMMLVVIMVMAAAMAVFVVVMMLVVIVVMAAAMAVFVVMMMLVVIVIVAAAMAVFMVVVVMVVMGVSMQLLQFLLQGGLAFHRLQQLGAGQLVPGGSHDRSIGIMCAKLLHCRIQLLLRNGIGAGKDNGGSCLHLVIIKLAKILHIHLYLAGIHHRNGKTDSHIRVLDLFYRADHIGQLAYAGRLDHDTVRSILLDHLSQCLAKVTHQRAADAAGIHFGDIDACILQEATVDADLSKFVFDQRQLLPSISLLDHFFDQRSLTGSQKAGVNINFRHSNRSF